MRLCRPLPRRVTSASISQYPCQELNLVYDLRRVACIHHTSRTNIFSIARWTVDDKSFVIAPQKYPTEESNLARLLRRQSCILHTRRANSGRSNRADDWIRTSMIPLTRRTPFSIEPRRHLSAVSTSVRIRTPSSSFGGCPLSQEHHSCVPPSPNERTRQWCHSSSSTVQYASLRNLDQLSIRTSCRA
jgi:hypothetical protein